MFFMASTTLGHGKKELCMNGGFNFHIVFYAHGRITKFMLKSFSGNSQID